MLIPTKVCITLLLAMSSASRPVLLTATGIVPHLAVLAQVNALVLLEVRCQPVNDALVKVVATQMGVTRGGQHLKHTITNLQGTCTGASGTGVLRLPDGLNCSCQEKH